jgi:hypothetical protein
LTRQHPHDAHLELLLGDEALLRRACSLLLERLAGLQLEAEDERHCVVRAADLALANLVRRAVMTRVDVLTCDEVEVLVNSSAFEDERVAHRLGQLAFASELLEADAVLSGADRDLLASDLKFLQEGVELVPDMAEALICKLSVGQRWESKIKLRRGSGADHCKFAAVASPGFEPELRLSEPPSPAEAEQLRAAGVQWDDDLVMQGLSRQEALLELAPFARVVWPPRFVRVFVESLGQRSAQSCVEIALAVVRREVREFLDSLSSLPT